MNAPTAEEMRAISAIPEEPWQVKHGEDAVWIDCNAFPCDGWIKVTGEQRQQIADFIVFVRNHFPAFIAMREELDRLRDMPTVTALAALEAELAAANETIKLYAKSCGQLADALRGE